VSAGVNLRTAKFFRKCGLSLGDKLGGAAYYTIEFRKYCTILALALFIPSGYKGKSGAMPRNVEVYSLF